MYHPASNRWKSYKNTNNPATPLHNGGRRNSSLQRSLCESTISDTNEDSVASSPSDGLMSAGFPSTLTTPSTGDHYGGKPFEMSPIVGCTVSSIAPPQFPNHIALPCVPDDNHSNPCLPFPVSSADSPSLSFQNKLSSLPGITTTLDSNSNHDLSLRPDSSPSVYLSSANSLSSSQLSAGTLNTSSIDRVWKNLLDLFNEMAFAKDEDTLKRDASFYRRPKNRTRGQISCHNIDFHLFLSAVKKSASRNMMKLDLEESTDDAEMPNVEYNNGNIVPFLCDAIMISCRLDSIEKPNILLSSTLDLIHNNLYPLNRLAFNSAKKFQKHPSVKVFASTSPEDDGDLDKSSLELVHLMDTLCAAANSRSVCQPSITSQWPGNCSKFKSHSGDYPTSRKLRSRPSTSTCGLKRIVATGEVQLKCNMFSFALLVFYWIPRNNSSKISTETESKGLQSDFTKGKSIRGSTSSRDSRCQKNDVEERTSFLVHMFSLPRSPFITSKDQDNAEGKKILAFVVRLTWVATVYPKLSFDTTTKENIKNKFLQVLDEELKSFLEDDPYDHFQKAFDPEEAISNPRKSSIPYHELLGYQMENFKMFRIQFAKLLRQLYDKIFSGFFKISLVNISNIITGLGFETKSGVKLMDIIAVFLDPWKKYKDMFESLLETMNKLVLTKDSLIDTYNIRSQIGFGQKEPKAGTEWGDWIFPVNTILLADFETGIYSPHFWDSKIANKLLDVRKRLNSIESITELIEHVENEKKKDHEIFHNVLKSPFTVYNLFQSLEEEFSSDVPQTIGSNHEETNIFEKDNVFAKDLRNGFSTVQPLHIHKQKNESDTGSINENIGNHDSNTLLPRMESLRRRNSRAVASCTPLRKRLFKQQVVTSRRTSSIMFSRTPSLALNDDCPTINKGSSETISEGAKRVSDSLELYRKPSISVSSRNMKAFASKKIGRSRLRYGKRSFVRRLFSSCFSVRRRRNRLAENEEEAEGALLKQDDQASSEDDDFDDKTEINTIVTHPKSSAKSSKSENKNTSEKQNEDFDSSYSDCEDTIKGPNPREIHSDFDTPTSSKSKPSQKPDFGGSWVVKKSILKKSTSGARSDSRSTGPLENLDIRKFPEAGNNCYNPENIFNNNSSNVEDQEANHNNKFSNFRPISKSDTHGKSSRFGTNSSKSSTCRGYEIDTEYYGYQPISTRKVAFALEGGRSKEEEKEEYEDDEDDDIDNDGMDTLKGLKNEHSSLNSSRNHESAFDNYIPFNPKAQTSLGFNDLETTQNSSSSRSNTLTNLESYSHSNYPTNSFEQHGNFGAQGIEDSFDTFNRAPSISSLSSISSANLEARRYKTVTKFSNPNRYKKRTDSLAMKKKLQRREELMRMYVIPDPDNPFVFGGPENDRRLKAEEDKDSEKDETLNERKKGRSRKKGDKW